MGIRFYCEACGRKLNVKNFLAGKRGVCPQCGEGIDIPWESQIEKGAPAQRPVAQAAREETIIEPLTMPARETPAASPQPQPSPQLDPPKPKPIPAPTQPVQPVAAPVAPVAPATPPSPPPAPTVSLDPLSEAPHAGWYVRPPGGGQYGPAQGEILRKWIDEGRVSGDSLVWREGWADWRSARELFPELPVSKSGAGAGEPPKPPEEDSPPSPASYPYRPKKKSMGFAIAVVVVLAVVCIALVAALVMVA